MKENILMYILSGLITLYHKREKLTRTERFAQAAYLNHIEIKKRNPDNKKPTIYAMIGLVGSGKTTIARDINAQTGASIINGDEIRIKLRQMNSRFERTRAIAEDVALEVIELGGDAIIDSDFIDYRKRASLLAKARRAGIEVIFVRTYCDLDISLGRILESDFNSEDDPFFTDAHSSFDTERVTRGKIVKIREMHRRTPHHYKWINEDGGKWVLKNLGHLCFTEIDTSSDILKYTF